MTCRKRRDDVKTVGSHYYGISSGGTCLRPERHPALRWLELARVAVRWNVGTWSSDAVRRSHKWKSHEGESTEAEHRGGTTRSSEEVLKTGWSEGVVLWSQNS